MRGLGARAWWRRRDAGKEKLTPQGAGGHVVVITKQARSAGVQRGLKEHKTAKASIKTGPGKEKPFRSEAPLWWSRGGPKKEIPPKGGRFKKRIAGLHTYNGAAHVTNSTI